MPGPKVAVNASGDWLYFVTGKCLSAMLIGGILALMRQPSPASELHHALPSAKVDHLVQVLRLING
jgi:hypothetical protein